MLENTHCVAHYSSLSEMALSSVWFPCILAAALRWIFMELVYVRWERNWRGLEAMRVAARGTDVSPFGFLNEDVSVSFFH